MAHPPSERIEVFDQAMTGLAELEPDWNLRSKYADFVDGAARLSEAEQLEWRARHDPEDPVMTFTERLRAEGKAEGKATGATDVLVDLVERGLLTADAARDELARLVAEGIVPQRTATEVEAQLAQRH